MKRFVLACLGVAVITTAAHAQSATPPSHVVAAGGSTNVTLSGMAGVQYALIASATNSGFSYAGVSVSTISTNSNTTVVTFSADSSFFVTIRPVRR